MNVSKHASPQQVTLRDGTVVDSTSNAWLAECEARQVLAMPGRQDRLNYLEAVGKRRGQDARKALEIEVWGVWEWRRLNAAQG